MLMAVDLRNLGNADVEPGEIAISTHVFVEVTETQNKTHQILTYLR